MPSIAGSSRTFESPKSLLLDPTAYDSPSQEDPFSSVCCHPESHSSPQSNLLSRMQRRSQTAKWPRQAAPTRHQPLASELLFLSLSTPRTTVAFLATGRSQPMSNDAGGAGFPARSSPDRSCRRLRGTRDRGDEVRRAVSAYGKGGARRPARSAGRLFMRPGEAKILVLPNDFVLPGAKWCCIQCRVRGIFLSMQESGRVTLRSTWGWGRYGDACAMPKSFRSRLSWLVCILDMENLTGRRSAAEATRFA